MNANMNMMGLNMTMKREVENAMGQRIARIGVTDEEPGRPVFVSLGVGAYVGSFLAVREAEQICAAMQAAILSARGVGDASHVLQQIEQEAGT